MKRFIKSKHDYSRLTIGIIVGLLFAYNHHGGDASGLVNRVIDYMGSATTIVALATRSPIDDEND